MKKRSNLYLLGILLGVVFGYAGSKAAPKKTKYPGGQHYIYRLTLTDKQNSPYQLDRPQRFLSQKSIERRRRQGLSLDSTDLPVSPKYIRMIQGIKGVGVVGRSRWQNTVLVRVKDTVDLQPLVNLSFIKKKERVWTSPDSLPETFLTKCHNTFNAWDSVHQDYYANGRKQIEMLHGQRLHAIGLKGHGMTIAILDGGFQNAHLISSLNHSKIAGACDFVCPPPRKVHQPPVTIQDYYTPADERNTTLYNQIDHGTKVLSVMAANTPEVLVGTAPEATYWLLRCEDPMTEQPVEEDYWTIAAEFADSIGVDIINSSLGYNEFDDKQHNYRLRDLNGRTALISRSASLLAGKGIILVNSAGNNGMDPWKKICVPADADNILTVGALTPLGVLAPFSACGPTQDGRVKPDIMALGSPAALVNGRGNLVREMGTSFSTPIVCGLVACLWQSLPEMSATDIIQLIRRASSQYDEPDNIYGYGTPNFWRAYMMGKLKD